MTNAKDITSSDVKIYFADGLPTDYSLITGLTFTPKFISVYPNSDGSQGGTLLTVTGVGFGVNTTLLGLKNITKSAALCKEVKVTGYGTFTCLTNAVAVASTDSLQITKSTTTYACANIDTTKCAFSQLAASSPTVTAASLAGSTITFTGTSFPASSDYTAKAVFKSASVAVASWDTTSLVAAFPNGLPAAAASENAVP